MKFTCTIEHLPGSRPLEVPPRQSRHVAGYVTGYDTGYGTDAAPDTDGYDGYGQRPVPASGLPLPVRDRIVLDAAPGEVPWHIALKFLGYLLYREWEPRVEEGVGWHYKPDLVSLDAAGNIRLWLDCGNIAARKTDRVAAKLGEDTPFRILRRTEKDARQLAATLAGKVRHPQRVRLIAFDAGFVDAIAAGLDSTNRIKALRGADRLDLTFETRQDRVELHSRLHVLELKG